jgi:hypothetical protein
MNEIKDYSGNAAKVEEAFIHKLPNETLADIFLLNASLQDMGWGDDRAEATIASSQVCSRWRSIALSYPTIWGCIINYNEHSLKWIDELLRRSEASLLDFGSRIWRIDLSGRHDSGLGVLKLVFNHTSRLRTFSLQAPFSVWELVRSRFLQQAAPNLEFLNLCILFDDGRVFIDPLFNNHAPSLRNLHLRRCIVDFTSQILTPLTELYVQEITTLPLAPTVVPWLHLLAEMPSLRRITIIDAISYTATEISFPTVHLVNLERLSVEGTFYESVTLINQLITPPRCGLRLRCSDAEVGLDQQRLWTIIDKKLDFWEKDTPGRRFMARHNEDTIAIGNLENISAVWEFSEAEEVYHQRILPLDPLLTVTLSFPTPEDAISLFISLFGLFERTFPTTSSLTLWTDYEAENGVDEVLRPLVDIFPSFMNLKELSLTNNCHSFLFPHLQRICPPASVLLPALHTVFFTGANFRPNSGSLTPVTAFLQWRRAQGFPIQKVNIYQCRVDREFVLGQLQDVEVEMDYINGSDSTEDTDFDVEVDSDIEGEEDDG